MARRSVSNLCRLMGSWISSGSASERTGTENRKWAITAASAWFLSFPGPPLPPPSFSLAPQRCLEFHWKGKFLIAFYGAFFSIEAVVPFQNRTRSCGVGIKLVLRLNFFSPHVFPICYFPLLYNVHPHVSVGLFFCKEGCHVPLCSIPLHSLLCVCVFCKFYA